MRGRSLAAAVGFALGAALLSTACGAGGEPEEFVPDLADVPAVDLEVRRFEHDLARAAADSARGDGAVALRAAYPVFFDSVWLEIMLPTRRRGARAADYDSALVAAFATQPLLARLLDSVTRAYPLPPAGGPAPPWQTDLERAFRYARYYLPDAPTPRVVTYVSELGLGAFTYGDALLGVGLDYHLGAGFPGYDPNVFPRYIQRAMNAEHIAPRAVEAWVSGLLGDAPGERMLDQMIHNGKLLYLKERLLPHAPDTAVLGFSESQLAWLRDNEAPMWAHYLDEELLYDTKPARIGKHVGVSPNAPGMPPEAPGGGANWVGMRIVEQYMARRPGATLADLIAERDAQRLLAASKYKPRG